MLAREWLFEVPAESNVEVPSSFAEISRLQLCQLAKRNMAVEVYSEILDCEIWFCSNESMAAQIIYEDTGAVTYTVKEIMELIRLNPSPEDIKRIHNAKSLFVGAKIKDSTLKR